MRHEIEIVMDVEWSAKHTLSVKRGLLIFEDTELAEIVTIAEDKIKLDSQFSPMKIKKNRHTQRVK